MLKVQLFGSGGAQFKNRPLAGFPGQQAGLLLCYLLLNRGQLQPRERLAAVFWEDRSAPTARKYLRNALWRLKSALRAIGLKPADYLAIGEDVIGWNERAEAWIDIDHFEQAVSNSQKATSKTMSRQQRRDLEAAAALYHGDLLDGIYEDWTLYERERLRLLYTNIRHKLMLHYTHLGRYEEALAHGGGLLAIDPAREKIHRQMMRLYALTGDRNAALAQYKHCKQLLRAELNLAPMHETRALYNQIKANRFDRTVEEPSDSDLSDPVILARLQALQKLAGKIKTEVRSLEKLLNQKLMDTDL